MWYPPAIKYASGKLSVLTSDTNEDGPAQKSFILSAVETKEPRMHTIDFGGYTTLDYNSIQLKVRINNHMITEAGRYILTGYMLRATDNVRHSVAYIY